MIAVRETRVRTATVRGVESAQLLTVLDEVAGGRACAVELAGDPGSGKTRLLAGLAEAAADRGFTVLRGLADPAERDLPGALFVQVLRGWLGLAERAGQREELLAVIRRIATSVDAPAGCPTPERLRALLEQHTCRGLLIVLDDVHAADPASLALLDRLVRWPVAAPVALVMSHRPRQAPQALRATFARGSQLGTTRRVELGPLDLAQSAELLDLAPTAPRLRTLHRDAHGNPLYLLALARICPGRPTGRPDGLLADLREPSPDAGLPDVLSRHLVTELAVLAPQQRLVLAAASVLGDDIDTAGVAAVSGLTEREACRLFDGLRRLDLLRPLSGTPRSAFRHPLVRWLVHDGTDSCWRIAAHRRAAGLLAARGAPAERLALHLERADPGRDPQDAAVLTAAARAALRGGDPSLAGHWITTALTALTRGGAAAPRHRVARELLDAAAEVAARTGSRGLLAEATARLGRAGLTEPAHHAGVVPPQAPRAPLGLPAAAPAARPGDQTLALLTGREREIAELASTGMRSREIADRLGLSARTVEVHLTRTYRKLGIGSRAALTRLVMEAGV